MSKTEMKTHILGVKKTFQLFLFCMSRSEDRASECIFGLCLQTSSEGIVCCVLPVAVGAYVSELEGSSH